MKSTPLHDLHGSGTDYAEVIRWQFDNQLFGLVRMYLGELPASHAYWMDILDVLSEAELISAGVDI